MEGLTPEAVLARSMVGSGALHEDRVVWEEASLWTRYAPALVLLVAGLAALAVQVLAFPYDAPDGGDQLDIFTEGSMALGALAGVFVVQRLRSSPRVYRPLMAGFTLVFVFALQDALDEFVGVPDPFSTLGEAIPQVLGVAVLAWGVTRWVAQRDRREARLEEQADQLGLLGRLIRHDIRNDMSVIKGVVLMAEEDADDLVREHLERIDRTADHTAELTDTAHHLVQLVRQGREVTGHTFDLASVLEREVEQARRRWPEASIEIDRPVPDAQVQAHQLFPAVVRNLVNNAIQHHDRDDPQVRLDTETLDGSVRFRVSDDGPGIPREKRAKLFGSAPRLDEEASEGVGLGMVRLVVDQSGGSIDVRDNEPSGTVVDVQLPRA